MDPLMLSFILIVLVIVYLKKNRIPPIPQYQEKWWGRGNPTQEDTSIRPFTIHVSDEILQDLKQRLDNALPFQEPLDNAKQHYGMNTNLLRTVVDFWKTKYNWREQETKLNKYPQFKTSIQGLDVHFIYVKPTATEGLKVLPLLLLHGWPGSVKEFYEMIPLLTTPLVGKRFVFEVIIPSLPGYGFSDGAVRPGLSEIQIAIIFKNLMDRLGFERYYVQGGDWGSAIGQAMAILYPEKLKGLHINLVFGQTTQRLKWFLARLFPTIFMQKKHVKLAFPSRPFDPYETGYFHIQSTKPDTIGVALRDSPVGLAAYILEKFTTGTNREWLNLDDGGLTKIYNLTDLLDNVMIYWVNRAITTSMRLYAERKNDLYHNPVLVPAGYARFNREIVFCPDFEVKAKYHNLVHLEDHEGGHFAAFEVPDVLTKDVYIFVDKVENKRKKNYAMYFS